MYNSNRIDEKRQSTWRYWTQRLVPAVELTPIRIAIGYAVFGTVGLFVSDVVLVAYLSEPLLSQVQALKGGVEVLLTAGFIFLLTNRRESQLQQTIQRLNHKSEELNVLHRILRHNLRNNLNIIMAHTEEMCEGQPSDQTAQQCEKILSATDNLAHYTEQATRVRQITAGDGVTQTHDIVDVVEEVAAKHEQDDADLTVSITAPDSLLVEASNTLKPAVDELITNAIEHNDSETPTVNVEVSAESGQSHMGTIRVADNGPGIPDTQLRALENGTEDQLLHLDGIGLWFVKWTVRQSKGELEFAGNEPRGTVVTVKIPKAPEELSSPLSRLNVE